MRHRVYIVLVLILLAAGFLRLQGLSDHDVINDEVFYGYRSIGLIDSLNSPFQPTPFEWYDEVPGWARLSFHDHPPLGFWIQHLFFRVFGNTLFAMRLPFALAGIGSVLLVFLICTHLFRSEKTGSKKTNSEKNPNQPDEYNRLVYYTPAKIGLFAAAIMAISGYHVWISRVGLQESLVIFLILLATWFFIRSLYPSSSYSPWFYWSAVVAAGLAILTKYTAVVLVSIFFVWLIWKRRDLLTSKKIIISGLLLLIILSPVIIYNFSLFQERGHLDFQLSYLLGQDVPEWEVRPGREVGGFIDRVQNLFVRYWQNAGPLFSVLTILGLTTAAYSYFRKDFVFRSSLQFLILNTLFLILLLFIIGPQERFIAMLTPFLTVLISVALVRFVRVKSQLLIVISLLLAIELTFTLNSFFPIEPLGREGTTYSYLRRDHAYWGYNQLDQYLEEELKGFYPEARLPLRFSFQPEIETAGKSPRSVLIINDSRIQGMASLWYLTRRTVYDGWTIISEQGYLELSAQDPDFFSRQGFDEFIFIRAEDTLFRDADDSGVRALEQSLAQQKILPREVLSPQGKVAFRVYYFEN